MFKEKLIEKREFSFYCNGINFLSRTKSGTSHMDVGPA
jgi:hypothetical protein